DHAAAAYNGRMYVAGGYDGAGSVSAFQKYDIASNTWSIGPWLPTPLGGEAIAAYNGNVYVVGGTLDGITPSSSVYIYTIALDTWSVGPSLPIPIDFPGYRQ